MLAIHYEVFFEVACHLSFSKAAEVLYISQPAVSKQVKKLEAELGVPLFERKGNSINLTLSGQKLMEYLHEAKTIQKKISSDLEIIKNQSKAKGELKIGASTTISLYVLPKMLSAFHKKLPNVKILLINRNSENVLKALLDREIDLAIIEAHHEINAVSYQPFIQDEVVAFCSKDSPFAGRTIDFEELKTVPMVLRERGSGTVAVLSKSLEEHQVKLGDLNIIARLGGTVALKNYVMEDDAIGFLSKWAVRNELEKGELSLVKVKDFKVDRRFNFVIRKGEESTGVLRALIRVAKDIYNY
ncbi:LysR substrate-binding domain-containing protein [Xanthovirga aplysinae]|uniref:LysR substrate-binding domain-containing protein n=1 Tax=Xanthovirga aplysinae TaxID=2529853 RepID=UPI0012BC5A39|nr:LysR substrate-binding domain-containing protein [Xanthovirga aplysinae]MTI30382.1 LysR family transcriptional regulator [Xanthovirga aplysinae]